MARGIKRHLKRVNAPKHLFLSKLGGVFAPKPSSGPHKNSECIPLCVLLRNVLKLALNYNEAKMMCIQRLIKVDGKTRTNHRHPLGLMDVVSIEKLGANGHWRVMLDSKGRYSLVRISKEEAQYKLCRVKDIAKGQRGVTHCTTHDGRTLRFPHPEIKRDDTVVLHLNEDNESKMGPSVHFQNGALAIVIGGNNKGRVGKVQHLEKHNGASDVCHLKDSAGHSFVTLKSNVMAIAAAGDAKGKSLVTLHKDMGIRRSNLEDRKHRMEVFRQ